MSTPPSPQRQSFRAIFLSDLHLGSSNARAKDVADFLKSVECGDLYLVGDIIDMWRLRQRWHWPEECNRVVRRILKMAKRGTRVTFIPGNHDEHARPYAGLHFGGVQILREAVHETLDGRRLLVTHGDHVDVVIRHARILSVLGSLAYDHLVTISAIYNRLRRRLGFAEWSLSLYIKLRVKSACTHIARFEEALVSEARSRGFHGVVCGHIHKAECRRIAGEVEYFNCGDWVEGSTALVEHLDGTLEVIDGAALAATLRPPAEAGAEDPEESLADEPAQRGSQPASLWQSRPMMPSRGRDALSSLAAHPPHTPPPTSTNH